MSDLSKSKAELVEELISLRALLKEAEAPREETPGKNFVNQPESLFTSLQFGVLVQTSDGRIIHANKIASDILDIPENEIKGTDSYELTWEMVDEQGYPVPDQDHPATFTFQTGQPVRNVVRGLFSGNPEKTRWLLFNTEPVFIDKKGTPAEVLITFIDITDLKTLELSRLESETKLQSLLNQLTDCLIIHDLQGNIQDVNDHSCLLYQYSRKEFLNMKVSDLDLDCTERAAGEAFSKKLNPYEPILFETSHKKKDGSVVPVEVSLNLIDLNGKKLVMALCRDISERLKFLRESKKSKNNFLNIIEHNPDAVIVVYKNLNIAYANSVASELFGRTRDQLIGSPFGLPLGDGDSTEIQLFSPGDEPRFGEMRIVDTEWENQDAWLVMIRDITDRKNAEEAKTRALEQLKEKAAETEAFLSSANSILTDNDFQTTARHIFNCCAGLCGASSGYVALLSANGEENKPLFLESGGMPCEVDPDLPMPVRGLRSETYRTGKAVFENDFENSEWMKFIPEGHMPLDNVLFAPLNIEGKVVGILGLSNKPGGFTEDDAVRTTAFSELAAIALHKSRTTTALGDERLLLNFAIEQMPIPVIIVNAPGGRINKYNLRALDLMAQPVDSISKIELEDHPKYWPTFYPDGRSFRPEELPLMLAIKEGKTTINQEVIIRQAGVDRWVSASAAPLLDKNGEIVAGILVFPEITDLKVIEAALQESQRILDATGKMAKIGGWEHNFLTGKSIWTRTVYDIVGLPYEAEPPNPKDHLDFYLPEDRAMVKKAVEHSIKNGTSFDLEVRAFHANKNNIWYRIQGKSVFKDNECVGIRGTVQDISDRKMAEQEKARLEEHYHQVQKVESIGRLAGGVAHDLNNLLTPIIGYSEMIKEELSLDNAMGESIDEILKAGLSARDLVRQLLAFSRKQTLEYHPVKMNNILANFENLLRRTIREDIDIRITVAADIPLIKADPIQIERVIMNLAVNSQDAMPEGGILAIDCSAQDIRHDFAARHKGVKPGSYVLLSFSDSGTGMDEETCRHVFEPFFSTKGERGTGLGLATVYGIVKQHGGNIWVYSKPGKGTTIEVYLPVSEKNHMEETVESKPSANLEGSEKILLVEDDAQVRDLAAAILRKRGYQVLKAASGSEALEIFKLQESSIDLLLTDIIMPEKNGKDLFDMASAIHPGIKVLFMSGYTDDIIADHGILEEHTSLIQKPFNIQALCAKVREVLDR